MNLFIHISCRLSHLGHKREVKLNLKQMKFNLNKRETKTKKKEKKHSLHFHTIFTLFTIFTVVLRDDIIIFFFFVIRDLHSLAFATRSLSLFDLLNFFRKKNRRFFIFSLSLRFVFRRDFFLCVDLCFRHVNEIRSFIVIKSMIDRIFFIYFVDETKSITLCSLAKSKRRCLKEFIQRQKTSQIFSTIYKFCCAKRAIRILL